MTDQPRTDRPATDRGQTTDDLDPGAYIGREPERVPRRELDGSVTLGDTPDEAKPDDRVDVTEGEVGSARLKEPSDVEASSADDQVDQMDPGSRPA